MANGPLAPNGARIPCTFQWSFWTGSWAWVAHHFCLHDLYSQDEVFLRDKSYPHHAQVHEVLRRLSGERRGRGISSPLELLAEVPVSDGVRRDRFSRRDPVSGRIPFEVPRHPRAQRLRRPKVGRDPRPIPREEVKTSQTRNNPQRHGNGSSTRSSFALLKTC